jgi:hypothetical protein
MCRALNEWRHVEDTGEVSQFSGSIGIITPYREQVAELRSCFQREFPGLAEDFSNASSVGLHCSLQVNTVDGFQGQERDVIIREWQFRCLCGFWPRFTHCERKQCRAFELAGRLRRCEVVAEAVDPLDSWTTRSA